MLTGELPGANCNAVSQGADRCALDEIVLRALDVNRTAVLHGDGVSAAGGSGGEFSDAEDVWSWRHSRVAFAEICNCCVTTPERLATLAGQVFLSQRRGQLLLTTAT